MFLLLVIYKYYIYRTTVTILDREIANCLLVLNMYKYNICKYPYSHKNVDDLVIK